MNGFDKVIAVFLIIAGMIFVFFGGALHILNTGNTHLMGLFGAIILSLIILLVFIVGNGNGKKTIVWISLVLAGGAAFAATHVL